MNMNKLFVVVILRHALTEPYSSYLDTTQLVANNKEESLGYCIGKLREEHPQSNISLESVVELDMDLINKVANQ